MLNFRELRDRWALKYQPSKSQIDAEFRSDQMANPHNERYHDKRPLRNEAQIISDLCYSHADSALTHQFGNEYRQYLESNLEQDRFMSHIWRYR